MSHYDFDTIIERRGSGSLKWDTVAAGVIPLWVADMDFAAPPALAETLAERARHPVYGYASRRPSYLAAVAAWYGRCGLSLDAGEILPGPGTVLSLGMILRACTAPGDGVLVMTPVYTPFFRVIREHGRKVVEAPLTLDENGRFVFDPAALESALDGASAEGVSVPLMFFCSPHNPGGRVWTAAEIEAVLDLARRRGITVASDEIHGDFVYERSFVSAASFDAHAGRTAVISGANKSFNLGGLHVSHFVIRDEKLRARISDVLRVSSHHEPDVFAELAVETCYSRCLDWFLELKSYLWDNLKQTAALLNSIPGIRAWTPDGTYLLWADARGLVERSGCADDGELAARLESEAKVKITPGGIYGKAGAFFVRINAASPRALLTEGLARIRDWALKACI